MKITGLILWVQENTISEKFYKKIGFDVSSDSDSYSLASLSGFELSLVNIREEGEFSRDAFSSDKGRGFYIYIESGSDINELYQQFLKLNLKPVSEPRDWPWGNREFVIKDPDGYKLCFYQKINN
jgi:catechol 2,3-dioxygenase-like lactoylglutathione lyase family enzyme